MKTGLKLACIVLLGFSSCKTKTYSFDNHPGPKIEIGEGGGMVGSLISKTLFINGQSFLQEGFDATNRKALDLVKKNKAKKIFKEMAQLNFNNIDYNKPGNLYRYIELTEGDKVHKVQWSVGSKEVNQDLVTIYNSINELLKTSE